MLLGIPVVGSFHTDIIDLLQTHGAYGFQQLCVLTKEAVDSVVLDSCATTSSSFLTKLSQQWVHCEHVLITAVDIGTFSADKRNEQLRLEMMFGDADGFLCVYVGRISNEKRLDVVLDAIRGLTGKSTAYLALVGDGPSAPTYAQMHGQQQRIHCVPRFLSHKQLAEVYASSDVHVSASEFETLGNTVLEAFACGVPVVVPRTQGFRDTVRHDQDGFLFEPGSSEDAGRYIQRLKDDAALRQRMGAKGRGAVGGRTIHHVVGDLLQWYGTGKSNRAKRGSLFTVAALLVMALTVPLTIFMFFVYNLIVNVLLKPFISYQGYAVTHSGSSSKNNSSDCSKKKL